MNRRLPNWPFVVLPASLLALFLAAPILDRVLVAVVGREADSSTMQTTNRFGRSAAIPGRSFTSPTATALAAHMARLRRKATAVAATKGADDAATEAARPSPTPDAFTQRLVARHTAEAGRAMLGPPFTADPRSSVELHLIERRGGPIRSVLVDDDLAYLGRDWRLEVVDFAAANGPALVGSTPVLKEAVFQDMAFGPPGSHIIYAATLSAGLAVVDIADPRQPRVVKEISFGNTLSSSVKVAGNRLYVAADIRGSGWIQVFDITDRRQPRTVARNNDTPGIELVLGPNGSMYALMWAWESSDAVLALVEVEGADVILRPVSFDAGEVDVVSLVMCDGHIVALMATPPNTDAASLTMQVFVVDTPTTFSAAGSLARKNVPVVLTYHTLVCGPANQVADAWWSEDGRGRVDLFEFSQPGRPQEIAAFSVSSGTAAWSGTRLLLDDRGLTLLDVRNPRSPKTVHVYYEYVDVSVLSWASRGLILNGPDLSPSMVHAAKLLESPTRCPWTASPTHSYFACQDGVASTITVTPLTQDSVPQIPQFGLSFRVLDLAIVDDLLVMVGPRTLPSVDGAFAGNLAVFDLSDPGSPQLVGAVDFPLSSDGTPENPWGPVSLAVGGRRAFIGTSDQAKVLDLSNPRRPQFVGHADFDAYANYEGPYVEDLAYHDGRVYAALGPAGMAVLEVRTGQ